MNCKNCGAHLQNNSDYCHRCGAKVVRNRLTIKNLFEHLSETFFNYDNKLLRTIIDLFKKPEVVIGGYISGIRKRYVNPISFLGIALTLTGITLFVMKKIDLNINYDLFNQGIPEDQMKGMNSFTQEYSSLLFLANIPLYAAASWLFLKSVNYNITERIVLFCYVLAQYSIIMFLPNFIILLFQDFYAYYSLLSIIFLSSYLLFVLHRVTKLRGIEFIGQVLVFLVFFGLLFGFLSLLFALQMFFDGTFESMIEAQKASREAGKVLKDTIP